MIKKNNKFRHPLMENNIDKDDISYVIKYLKQKEPQLTQSKNVRSFEQKWSKWLGVKYSIFVNSGSSANLLSLCALKEIYGVGEIIVPSLTWVSDIASVIQLGFKPIFVDINKFNLSMNTEEVLKKINRNTKAVFITYAQGFNGLNQNFLYELKKKSIPLIEDVCESHGAKFNNKKLGSFGLISNFSFYYAHHMSTIEGGMVSTNSKKIYDIVCAFRSHGMLREINNDKLKQKIISNNKLLNKDFIFLYPAYNMRSTEINALIGINQLKKLDQNIKIRNRNHKYFLENVDNKTFFTDFDLEGSSNYALNLVLRKKNKQLMKRLMLQLKKYNIEFRIGSAGGGNQLRQPYLKKYVNKKQYLNYLETEHVHFFGMYIGNYPTLTLKKVRQICKIINSVK